MQILNMTYKRLKRECVTRLKVGHTYSRYPFRSSNLFTIIRRIPDQSELIVHCHQTRQNIIHRTPFKCYRRDANETDIQCDHEVFRRRRCKAPQRKQCKRIYPIHEP